LDKSFKFTTVLANKHFTIISAHENNTGVLGPGVAGVVLRKVSPLVNIVDLRVFAVQHSVFLLKAVLKVLKSVTRSGNKE